MVGLRKCAAVLAFAFIAAASMLTPMEASAQSGFDVRTGHYYGSSTVHGDWHAVSVGVRSEFRLGRPGYLATIKDAVENTIVQAVTDYFWGDNQDAKWLGGYDLSLKHNKWQWITEDLFTYTNWAPGEPNNSRGNEPVLEMLGLSGGRWNDVPYNDTSGGRGFGVVEWSPSEVTLLSMTGPSIINSPKLVNYTVTLAATAPRGGVILFLHSDIPAIAGVLPKAITIPGGSSSLVVPLAVGQIRGTDQVGYIRVYGKNKMSLPVTVTP